MIGVAPKAKVLSVRVILEDEEPGFRKFNTAERYENVVARGIRYAVDHGADVINMSISKELATKEERAAIRYAISKGVVLVAAAGNEGAKKPGSTGFAPYSYPAAFPGVVSVAAADGGLRRASFSNWNPSVLVAAPGVDILGAGPGDEYWVGRGTSQATALVSGIAALIKAKYPKMSPALVAQALAAGATRRPSGGYDTGTGFGIVNAPRALAAAAKISRHTLTARGRGSYDPARPLGKAIETGAGGPPGPAQDHLVHGSRRGRRARRRRVPRGGGRVRRPDAVGEQVRGARTGSGFHTLTAGPSGESPETGAESCTTGDQVNTLRTIGRRSPAT